MFVLHVDTERGWRGGERQALWLAQSLAERGHGSIVAARGGEPLADRARDIGLEVVPCAPLFEADALAALRLRRVVISRRIDIVHAHTAHAAALGALATIGTDARLVAARRVDFRLRDNVGTRLKYGRARAIIAISHAVARALAESGVDPSRVHVVPDATDTTRRIVGASREVLASLGVPAGTPLVVQVSQLVGHKDPVNFVRAIAAARIEAPSLHALLVGDGVLRGEVEREIALLGLGDVVHLAGYRTDADSLLAAADVASLSSKEEGMGSVLLDAMLLGKPVAATRAGGIPEIVLDGESGLLAPVADPQALGGAIARLVNDRALAARVGAAGRARVNAFSVDRMAERTLAVYERVLASR